MTRAINVVLLKLSWRPVPVYIHVQLGIGSNRWRYRRACRLFDAVHCAFMYRIGTLELSYYAIFYIKMVLWLGEMDCLSVWKCLCNTNYTQKHAIYFISCESQKTMPRYLSAKGISGAISKKYFHAGNIP